MSFRVCCCILLLVTCAKAGADNQPLFKSVSGWDVRVDTTLGNGCFLHTAYEGGTVIRLGVNRLNDTAYFMFANSAWASLEQGKTYAVKVYFGDEAPWFGDAIGIAMGSGVFLTLSFEEDQVGEFLAEFMQEQNVDIHYKNRSISNLKLTGSYKAGLTLIECQQVIDGTEEGTQDDPFEESSSSAEDPFA